MASNSFKVKNSLVLTPKDLSTLTNPEAGDLACDINDNNKIKRYDQERADWVEVGSGGGGGLDVFYSENVDDLPNVTSFDKGNNASFMGGGTMAGTFSFEEINPISGLKSLKYIQAASGSLNDYFASDFIDIDPKQQGKTCGLTLYFNYNGDNGDGRFVVFDATNNQEISDQLALVENTGGRASRYSLSFTVPPSCNQIRWGYQVLVENSGADLLVDDVEMTTDPFVIVPQPDTSSISASGASISGNGTINNFGSFSNSNPNILSQSSSRITALKKCVVDISISGLAGAPGKFFIIRRNGSNYILGTSAPATNNIFAVSGEVPLEAGEYIEVQISNSATTTNQIEYKATARALSDQILTPSDTFSTDTAPLTYAPSSQYTLSTLENAPVGTYITFTYAANTNTRTQSTVRPFQSDADMNQNGMRIFARPYNLEGSAGSPTAFAIQIGKGLKGWSLQGYSSTNKSGGQLQLDIFISGTASFGMRYKSYSEKTGILILDAGVNVSNSTGAFFETVEGTSVTNGYLTINAGKTLPLLAVPTPKVAYLKDVKPSGTAGGTFTSGAWQTRTLNTVEGDGSIVSLNANQFTLPAGKYEIEATAPTNSTNGHKAKLRNITDSSDSIIGTNGFSGVAANMMTVSLITGTVNILSPKTFEIQHRCQTTRASDGFGFNNSYDAVEVYAQVKITKLS